MDMIERPEFVDELLDAICEHNMVLIRHAIDLGVDCIHFGDDYGSQRGLIMGLNLWRRFIKPRLARMYKAAADAGKYVSQYSCGCVQELFDDLVEMGLNMFNPFQPEVMDVFEVKRRYHGRLSFHGGMSIQKTLPFGTIQEVRDLARPSGRCRPVRRVRLRSQPRRAFRRSAGEPGGDGRGAQSTAGCAAGVTADKRHGEGRQGATGEIGSRGAYPYFLFRRQLSGRVARAPVGF